MCPMQLGCTGLRAAETPGKLPFQGPHSMWPFCPGPIESLTAGPVGFPISQGVRQTPARGYLGMFPTDFHPRKLLGGEEPPAHGALKSGHHLRAFAAPPTDAYRICMTLGLSDSSGDASRLLLLALLLYQRSFLSCCETVTLPVPSCYES